MIPEWSCEELTRWKRLWCWEGLGAGGEGEDRGWDGWMASWLNGHESGWTPGVGDGQGCLVCCDSWGHKELDITDQLNWTELNGLVLFPTFFNLRLNLAIRSSWSEPQSLLVLFLCFPMTFNLLFSFLFLQYDPFYWNQNSIICTFRKWKNFCE